MLMLFACPVTKCVAANVHGIISSSTAQSSYDLSGKYRRIIKGIFLALAKDKQKLSVMQSIKLQVTTQLAN